MTTIADFGTLSKKWDPKHLEIRTMSVEKTLEPLVLQVTTLVNTKGPSKKKKGLWLTHWTKKCVGACHLHTPYLLLLASTIAFSMAFWYVLIVHLCHCACVQFGEHDNTGHFNER